jgi:hypothetical protein
VAPVSHAARRCRSGERRCTSCSYHSGAFDGLGAFDDLGLVVRWQVCGAPTDCARDTSLATLFVQTRGVVPC